MESAIETDHLTKRFDTVTAVDDVSIRVYRGEIYGFLGLNGAGKTTTIRMLLGMIRPGRGKAFLCGQEVRPNAATLWKSVGYIVEIPYSYPDLTVRENLEITRRLRFIDDKKAVDAVIEKMHLEPYAERKAKHLSLGNTQRLGLAKALIHNPSVLIMDEPANGLDPAGIQEIRELFKELAVVQGVTIFISSHILDEISKFANRIGIIHSGRLIREVESSQLEALRSKRLIVRATDNKAAQSLLSEKGYSVNNTEDENVCIEDDDAIGHPEAIATLLVQKGIPPTLLKVEQESLESYFLRTIESNGGAQ